MHTPSFQTLTPAHREELCQRVGQERVLTTEVARDKYGRDYTEDLHFPPEVVVLPTTVEAVAAVLRFAHRERLPVTPRGAGTGVSGGALPVHGGIVLSLERFDRIREINTGNLTATVEVGVITGDLQRAVEEQGLFYPPDPASRDMCFLGGNLAEDSAGPRSCKYGSTRRWVLGLEAVLADGTILHTGGANRKDVTGYNLTQLLVGSEGTLAVITAATLRLTALPKATLSLALPFPTLEAAAGAVEALFLEGFQPAACELMAREAMESVARFMTVPEAFQDKDALLILELDGDDPDALLEQAAVLGEMAESDWGATEVLAAQDAAEQRRLWQARRMVAEAIKAETVFRDVDTVVPRSRLVELVRASRRAAADHGLGVAPLGHAGDGNLHILLLKGDLSDAEWHRRRDAAEDQLLAEVIALGGAITAEHGVGWTQRRHLTTGLDPAALVLMRGIKATFDPHGILNPGKIFPDLASARS